MLFVEANFGMGMPTRVAYKGEEIKPKVKP